MTAPLVLKLGGELLEALADRQRIAVLAASVAATRPLIIVHGGRLIAAAGRSGAAFVLDHAGVKIGPVALFVDGVPHDERAGEAHEFTTWTCDFSAEYVKINAAYRT